MVFTDKYFDLVGSVYYHENVDKLPRTKENALLRFCSMICRSWTFERMTQAEKERCISAFLKVEDFNALRGDYAARWCILQAVYDAFLSGLGYTGGKWREENKNG